MAVTLPEPSQKSATVEAMFDRIAGDYDRMNRIMTLGMDRAWRRHAIDAVRVGTGDVVVDLACGTGDLAEEAAGRGARVIGVDVSAGMLAGARLRRVPATFGRAFAEQLPFADACCDALVSGFALRNFTDLRAALGEAARVVRPGGRIALLEVDTPKSLVLRAGHGLYFRHVVPLLGRMLADRAAYSYLPSSVTYLPAEAALLAMIDDAGFAEVSKRRFLGGATQLVVAERCAS